MLELNNIYNMDCVEGLKQLDDNSIDLIVTSALYNNLYNRKKNINIINNIYGRRILNEYFRLC